MHSQEEHQLSSFLTCDAAIDKAQLCQRLKAGQGAPLWWQASRERLDVGVVRAQLQGSQGLERAAAAPRRRQGACQRQAKDGQNRQDWKAARLGPCCRE